MLVPSHPAPEAGGGLTLGRLLTEWQLEPVPLVVVAVAAGGYLFGVRRLRRRGDAWPWSRTLAFCGLGLGAAVVATQSALATYDTTLLSAHMVQHMVLSMVVPIFLALGAPVTLALRTLPDRPRRWLLRLLHSRGARVLTLPPVAFLLFVVSPWALYFTGWYDATLRSAALHALLHLHFVLVGSLFFWPLLGRDPVPGRMAYPLRLLAVFATLPFHAFLGVTVMSAERLVIGGSWYRGVDQPLGVDALADQRLAGGLLWAAGDLVGLAVFAVLFTQWVLASQREAAREDRRLDRLAVGQTTPGATRGR